MNKKFTPRPEFTSPRAICSYPRLIQPDTKFDADGDYTVKLILSAEQVKTIRDQAKGVMDAYIAGDIAATEEEAGKNAKVKPTLKAKKEAKDFNMSIKSQVDEEGNDTGAFEVTFKQAAKIATTDRKTGKKITKDIFIPLFDGQGKEIVVRDKEGNVLPNVKNIWGGSELKVRYSIIGAWIASSKVYHASLRPVGVQVLRLVSGTGSRDAKSCGFEAEEGAFVADDATEAVATVEEGAPSSDGTGY